ncbi:MULTISPECIES: hypothetical protein [Pseudomonadati]|uniref:Uncharacterized protein n=1 Tax=Shewanella aestuarii TaxID=1028752 RepID=A0ABT0KX50_9GAMM|nr:hypothetical protein [Shewanella aestuarii]MCL1116012.1 hypothetical protein [Shewanella aestuarii]GGN69971.1 hypothetical protein GCM10009193_04460 [Shewanella aestuarii]
MSLAPLYQSLQYATIIGNADGQWHPSNEGATITFNATAHNEAINICNGPYAGVSEAFRVERSVNDAAFVDILTTVAQSLVNQVDCWPSSGLTTAVMLAMISKQVSLMRMSLLPSLARNECMHVSETLPCMVHNWLGERRIAMGIALTHSHLYWPELYVKPHLSNANIEKVIIDPFTILLGPDSEFATFDLTPDSYLKTQAQFPVDYDKQLIILKKLALVDIQFWLVSATQEKLLQCEKLFYNQTPEDNQSNWFLVDFKASQYLDPIRHQLAYCQQVLALQNIKG